MIFGLAARMITTLYKPRLTLSLCFAFGAGRVTTPSTPNTQNELSVVLALVAVAYKLISLLIEARL